MTDLKNRLMLLLTDEPDAPDDIERIVGTGRRARRRRNVAVATAGTIGAAGLTAGVVIPVVAAGGHNDAVIVGVQPKPSPSATTGKCYFISAPAKEAKRSLARMLHSGKVGGHATVKEIRQQSNGRTVLEVCSAGAAGQQPNQKTEQPPAGPPYDYTEKPEAIASRLGTHLHDRVTGLGLSINYTRPFAQESTKLDKGRPTYFDGNVDVRVGQGYGDIGVQVTHATTQQVPFDGSCTADTNCTETTLSDGSVVRTGQVKAGPGLTVLTAEVHRPDGVVVQAQESNYPFGPDAATQPHGDQPLTLDQLVNLAEDAALSF